MVNDLNDFPFQEETLLIEFKREWYWTDNCKKMKRFEQQLEGEFIRDIVALFNTVNFQDSKKLIIGFDEKTHTVDKGWKNVKLLQSIEELRKKIIKKIDDNFKTYPENNDFKLENFFSFEEEHECLIINIRQAPFLLIAKKEIFTKKAKIQDANVESSQGKVIEGECPARVMLNDVPTTTRLTQDTINQVCEELREKTKLGFFAKYTKTISIEKIVDVYKKTTMPKGQKEEVSNVPYGCVLYTLEYHKNFVIFFYLSNLAVQREGIDFLKHRCKLEKASEINIFVDSKNKNDKKTKVVDNILASIPYLKDMQMPPKTIDEWVDSFCHDILEKITMMTKKGTSTAQLIQSYVEENDEKGLQILNSWIDDDGSPALIIRGSGGIGKTTLLKQFLNKENVNFNKTIVQITAKSIDVHSLRKKENVTLLDLCKEALQDEHEENKEIIDLALSAGRILLVIDGLDEIVSKLNRKLDIDNFFKSINIYFLEFFKIKILITCRYTDHWTLPDYIRVITLKEFDEYQIDEYSSNFNLAKPTIEKIKKKFTEAKTNEIRVIPYVLDLLKDGYTNLLESHFANLPTFLSKENIDDCIIIKLCDRETDKHNLDTFSTEEQIKIFIKIATIYNGSITTTHIEDLANKEGKISLTNILPQHPILLQDGEQYVFRYEFWNLKFKVFGLVKQMKEMCLSTNIEIFDQSFQDLFLEIENDELKQYFGQHDNLDNLKLSLIKWIGEDFKIDISKHRSFNSKFFLFLLLIDNGNTGSTQLLEEIYTEGSYINNLCIIGPTKVTFHFENKTFCNCYFDEYEYFLRCHFNKATRFLKCEFNKIIGDKQNKDVTKNLFDLESCLIDIELKRYLGYFIDPIMEILDCFHNGIAFVNKKIKEIDHHWGDSQEFKKLLEYGVIRKNIKTSMYYIDDDYLDLEENIENRNTNHPIIDKIKKELSNPCS